MADREKRGENWNTKIWVSQERKDEMKFIDEMKNIFDNYLRAIMW